MKVNEGRPIAYDALMHNVEVMINTLEYDSMRSAGKCKANAAALNDLYLLADNLNKRNKPAAKKEG